MSIKDEHLIVALDIGTSKVAAFVGEVAQDGGVNVIGMGVQPSRGLKRGVVVNIEATVKAILRAVEEAELMAGCHIHSAFTGIAGSHIHSLNSHGIVAVRDREVTKQDVDRVIDAAKAVAVPADQKILHVLPQEYMIDSQDGVRDPIGMSGVRLEAKVHIVTGAVSAAQNIVKCVERCNLKVGDIVLEQLASSYAVLSDDEKDLGICLVDIGGGTTDIAVFVDGAIRHTAVIPIAGDHVSSDIASALRTSIAHAERVKMQYGSAMATMIESDAIINVPTVSQTSTREISQRALSQVIEARYEELLSLVKLDLQRSGFLDDLSGGIVFTGGSSKMVGCIELAEQVIGLPARLGKPTMLGGLPDVLNNPAFSTGAGLLLYGQRNQKGLGTLELNNPAGLWERMKSWFQGNF